MPFSFAAPALPMTIRVCRSLVWTQAAFVLLGGAFVVFAATVFGNSNQIPVGADTLSGGSAIGLGMVYIGSGLALIYLGVELGRLAPWARNALVCAEVFLAVLLLLRSFDLSVSTVVNMLFCVAIVGLLVAPDTRRALAGVAAATRPETAGPA